MLISATAELREPLARFIAANTLAAAPGEIDTVLAALRKIVVDGDQTAIHELLHAFIEQVSNATEEAIGKLFLHAVAAPFMRLSARNRPSILAEAFRESPFATEKEDQKGTGWEFVFHIELEGRRLKLAGLLADAAALISGEWDVPAPKAPDMLPYSCGDICRAVSYFPWSHKSGVAIEHIACFDEVLVWTRDAMNYFYEVGIQKFEDAGDPMTDL
jgi:hypothetical protein